MVIVPCGINAKMTDEQKNSLFDGCSTIENTLKELSIRAECDLRDNYSPGWKFNHWELKVSDQSVIRYYPHLTKNVHDLFCGCNVFI